MYCICFVINIGLSPNLQSQGRGVGVGEETTYILFYLQLLSLEKNAADFY